MSKTIITDIRIKIGSDKSKLTQLIADYNHMSINRLFIAQQRKYELLIYHFLERYYSSQIAINSQKDAIPKKQ